MDNFYHMNDSMEKDIYFIFKSTFCLWVINMAQPFPNKKGMEDNGIKTNRWNS